MGMDGLSMANTGILKESTSADFANRTEQTIAQDPTNNTKQVQTLNTNKKVVEKNEEENEGHKKNKQEQDEDDIKDTFEDSSESHENDSDESFDIKDLENPNKDFFVKLNSKDDIIELYESSTNRLIETISGNELQGLVRKLNMASGIFINKKV